MKRYMKGRGGVKKHRHPLSLSMHTPIIAFTKAHPSLSSGIEVNKGLNLGYISPRVKVQNFQNPEL